MWGGLEEGGPYNNYLAGKFCGWVKRLQKKGANPLGTRVWQVGESAQKEKTGREPAKKQQQIGRERAKDDLSGEHGKPTRKK